MFCGVCASKPQISHARVVMLIVKYLHEMGYPVYAQCQQSPSGMWWRLSLEYDNLQLVYSDSQGSDYFAVNSWFLYLKPYDLAKRLIQKHKMQPRKPTTKESLFIRWYERVLETICFNDVIVEVADWYERPEFVELHCSSHIEHRIPFFQQVLTTWASQKTVHPFLEPFQLDSEESTATITQLDMC